MVVRLLELFCGWNGKGFIKLNWKSLWTLESELIGAFWRQESWEKLKSWFMGFQRETRTVSGGLHVICCPEIWLYFAYVLITCIKFNFKIVGNVFFWQRMFQGKRTFRTVPRKQLLLLQINDLKRNHLRYTPNPNYRRLPMDSPNSFVKRKPKQKVFPAPPKQPHRKVFPQCQHTKSDRTVVQRSRIHTKML